MVVQGTALIAGITAAVLVLAIMMGVMMVHVIAAATFGQVSSNIPFDLEGMLDVDADQWHYAGSLGPQK
jgi:ribonuclease PH